MKTFKALRLDESIVAVSEQDDQEDPVQVARDKNTKTMKIARLKKQIQDLQKSDESVDEDEIEESRFEVAIKGFPWHVYVDANNPNQVKKDMGKMLRPGYSITTIHMAR